MGSLVGVNGLTLGTFELEDTEDAVTPQQATELLPLWQMVQSGSLQGDAETQAVVRQIEGVMTESQRAAIDAMGSTFDDVQAWMEEQGIEMPARPELGQGGAGAFQDMSEDERAQMQQQFQSMSPEERATRRGQFAGQGGRPGAAASTAVGSSRLLIAAVTRLLVERSGAPAGPQVTPTATVAKPATARVRPTATPSAEPVAAAPAPTATLTTTSTPERADASAPTPAPTPEPAVHSVQAGETLAAIAQAYGVTVYSIVEANAIGDPNAIHVGQRLVIPDPGRVPISSAGGRVGSLLNVPAAAAPTGALTWLPDTDPGPPFSVKVSLNRAIQGPVVE